MRRLVAGLAAVVLATVAVAADGKRERQAYIPFATSGGIDRWKVVDDDTLYIRGRDGCWYKAELFGPCFGLRFSPAIGFVVRHGTTFDHTSSIVVDGRECRLSSLVELGSRSIFDELDESRDRKAEDEKPKDSGNTGKSATRQTDQPKDS